MGPTSFLSVICYIAVSETFNETLILGVVINYGNVLKKLTLHTVCCIQ